MAYITLTQSRFQELLELLNVIVLETEGSYKCSAHLLQLKDMTHSTAIVPLPKDQGYTLITDDSIWEAIRIKCSQKVIETSGDGVKLLYNELEKITYKFFLLAFISDTEYKEIVDHIIECYSGIAVTLSKPKDSYLYNNRWAVVLLLVELLPTSMYPEEINGRHGRPMKYTDSPFNFDRYPNDSRRSQFPNQL